jgi:predicted DNA-binding transcriptional regulator AlpA
VRENYFFFGELVLHAIDAAKVRRQFPPWENRVVSVMFMNNTNLMTEKEAAEKLAVSLATLRRRRLERRPPDWVKIGASVRYKVEDLESFIESCVVVGEGRAA